MTHWTLSRRGILRAATLLAGSLAMGSLHAQAPKYPQKPVRLVVPFAAGGAIDAMARPVAEALGRELGQPVIVDNKPGAAGNLGAALVAKAPADGYTLLVGTSATHGANPSLFANLQYDAVADFEPLSLWGAVPNVLVVNAVQGARSVPDLIKAAQREPGQLTYGSAGAGTSLHLAGVMFEKAAKVQLMHVPYKGGAPASMDLLGGSVNMMFDTVSVALPNLRAGKLRALAVAAPERHFALPDVPTFAELGLPGVDAATWAGVFAPRGTPPAVVQELEAAFARVLAQKPVQEALRANGVQIQSLQGERFRSFVTGEIRRWGQLVREARITPE
ncbi:Bug family tripartite tricarboxylate transporter substrate binding protein [Paenacidovorax monticola]|uniref:Tripartite tricarboxylate transporter substrate binding protein n=1 Tax=Paenacidovorax monticola TaxID=1926868 RepID=A0A7H0HCF5_9BURK|nr:tripartite tricarboxylate transporter substrate binding protein [Paenacidovorax monticola]QNP58221.1 tripartite tricarboxylate transporter substrate binding protein [Paenacidovorax monticola]